MTEQLTPDTEGTWYQKGDRAVRLKPEGGYVCYVVTGVAPDKKGAEAFLGGDDSRLWATFPEEGDEV